MLCLDVGNTNLFGGLFQDDKVVFRFRKSGLSTSSPDEIGLFLKAVLREHGYDPATINALGICSVVPESTPLLRHAAEKYFKVEPFVLQAGVKTGLKIKYRNPVEVGADRIANCIAAAARYPNQNVIVVDFGTATTFDVLTKDREYLGGAIVPGVHIAMESLSSRTALLKNVEIVAAESALGRSTIESIQSGLFFGTVGAVKELLGRLTSECFNSNEKPVTVATGGHSRLFKHTDIFEAYVPDLVLEGLYNAYKMNLNLQSAE